MHGREILSEFEFEVSARIYARLSYAEDVPKRQIRAAHIVFEFNHYFVFFSALVTLSLRCAVTLSLRRSLPFGS